jgi:hypothetical protein
LIAKIFETYVSLGNLSLSLRESTLLPKEGALLLGELGLFPKENSLLPKKIVFFTKELFLLHGELAWDWHLVLFCPGKLLLKSN